MELDYLLLAGGGALLALAALLGCWLVFSRRRHREYRRLLREDAERTDILETLRHTQTEKQEEGSASTPGTDAVSDVRPGASAELSDSWPLTEAVGTAVLDAATARMNIAAEAVPPGSRLGEGLDLSPLAGKYLLLRELHGGGMSRVFLARHVKLGNEWIVKYVDGAHAGLADEAEVLKKLNHISLPQIIDVFQSRRGTFLVERYIEGYTLDQVIRLGQETKESLVIDWGLQLAQVLHYLHNLETPIIHCDLKPSNIMVTYDNRLVLIDFGISKQEGVTERELGLTYRYAAPEQFHGSALQSRAAQLRFGELPPGHEEWKIDARTDLYSTGVLLYELLTGEVPTQAAKKDLRAHASARLAEVVERCIVLDPAQRWQSAQELAAALEGLRTQQLSMARSLMRRRAASVCTAVLLAAGLGTSASGAYLNRVESQAVLTMSPGEIVVTAQQGVNLLIQKETPGGRKTILEPGKMEWTYTDSTIARLDGNRLVGLNVGESTLHGRYRNKEVTLHVTVTEPVAQAVEISLRYPQGGRVSVYAGNGVRETADGSRLDCSMVSPEKITADGEDFYFSDSGLLRGLEEEEVYSVWLEPEYLTTRQVWSVGEAFYVLTGPWEEDDGESYYGFLEITDDSAAFLYYTEAAWSVIPDFAFDSGGLLWFIQQNLGMGETSLYTLDTETLEQEWVMDLPESACSMVFDGADNLYIAVPEDGTVVRVGAGESSWSYFAGVEGERNFIDGPVANFYRPTSLALFENALYVLDFDTVRRIAIDGAAASGTETVAGVPVADTNPELTLGAGCETLLPASELASLAVSDSGRLLLTDPKNSVIYEVQCPR